MSARVARMLGAEPAGPDALGFVFPVYGWRVPRILARFLATELAGRLQGARPSFVWAVMTCGDDVGQADRVLERELRATVGLGLDAAYSVNMPDTYLGLPGFRLDSPDELKSKYAGAETRIRAIRAALAARDRRRDLKRGAFAWAKTSLVGTFFDRFLGNDRRWRDWVARRPPARGMDSRWLRMSRVVHPHPPVTGPSSASIVRLQPCGIVGLWDCEIPQWYNGTMVQSHNSTAREQRTQRR